MAFGSVNEYFAWIERESPSVEAQEVTGAFPFALDGTENPGSAPLFGPVPEMRDGEPACRRGNKPGGPFTRDFARIWSPQSSASPQ